MRKSPACPFCSGRTEGLHPRGAGEIRRCRSCRLRFVTPQPDEATLAGHYARLYHAPLAAAPFTSRQHCDQIVDRQLLPLFERSKPSLAIDVGCGDGALAESLAARGVPVLGIDPYASSRRDRPLVVRDPPGAAAPDLVVMNEVIEHFRRPWVDVAFWWRRLAPGGVLYVSTPNFSGLRARLLGARFEQYLNPTHLYFFTGASLARLLGRICRAPVRRLRTAVSYGRPSRGAELKDRLLQRVFLDGSLKMTVRKAVA